MDRAPLVDSLSRLNADQLILDRVRDDLNNLIKLKSNIKVLAHIDVRDGPCIAVSAVKEADGSSALFMSTLSDQSGAFGQPPLLIGLLAADITCGTFVTVGAQRLFAVGDVNSSVTLFSCQETTTILAKIDYSVSGCKKVLGLIHDRSSIDSKAVSLWVAYADTIEHITCNLIEGRVSQFFCTLVLHYNRNLFGSFDYFEVN